MRTRLLHIILLVFITANAQQKITEDLSLKFQEHFFEALTQKAINNHKRAIENLEICYQIDSINTSVKFELSKNYFLLKEYSNANIFIDKALYSNPLNIFLQQQKVTILKAQNRLDEAIKIQQKIIKAKPIYTQDLVLLYIQNKEYKKANLLVAEIENNGLTTSRVMAYKNYLSKVLNNHKSSKAKPSIITTKSSLQELQKAFTTSKKYTILIQLLNKELELNLFKLLLKDTQKGLAFFPTQPKLYIMQGMAYNKLNQPKKAIETLLIGIDFVVDNKTLTNFYTELLISYKMLNNKVKIIEIENKLKKIKES